jgi:hypothetical protein
MIELMNLEIHAWDGCNLHCESCSHFSSLGIRRGPNVDECRTWMQAWAQRLKPRFFSIVGGEPTLNPNLTEIVRLAGRVWDKSHIRLVTNGFRLGKHAELPAALVEIRNRCTIEVSSHHNGPEFQQRFAEIRSLCVDWKGRYGLDIRILDSEQRWTRRYNYGVDGIEFPDGEPRAAWEACEGKRCRQIHAGKLWKCPPIAYFEMAAERNKVADRWRDLAASYVALTPDCSEAELAAFLGREHEEICRLCPSKPEHFILSNPLIPIKRYKSARNDAARAEPAASAAED